ncbi:MMPL family transporter [Corynebacterium propinquum]|uniref:MMPL family transporter n=1 Tax=Corynebacterium propinquum TaxID=43769 RepID=UPI000F883616|nr:MMPL family transporter [Corynebacterium propinquum]MCT1817990.1 MMPL family transporter [Corynebacterium propinquum]MDK4235635.1 MMPL family transporter [Corynebacterium propinquum]MDK4258359.1 MMPL family transporter [Corynebacterium propinquum]MDK4293230.1 MMPL family transporter [Corynebacterium propinquum]MDK4299054.1 MMPL family transporter [Corynebacterium propinquum]
MAKFLYRLGLFSFRHSWSVIIAWVVILAASVGAALSLSGSFTGDFEIDDTPTIDTTKRVVELFPEGGNPAAAATVNLVFQAPEGEKLSDPDNTAAIDDVIASLEEDLVIEDELRFGNPVTLSPELVDTVERMGVEQGLPEETARLDAEHLRLLNDDETIGWTTFRFDAPNAYEVQPEQYAAVHEAMDIGRAAGLTVEASGEGFGDPIAIELSNEWIGLSIAFLVLVVTFGSLIAAILPIVTAIVAVAIGALWVITATGFAELNDMTPVLALMVGLAVGIDYALFVMSRYRSEQQRLPNDKAIALACGTAGSSVVFAGLTNFIALAMLWVAQIEFLTAMGLAAAATVALATVVPLTLLPAILGLLGDRAFGFALPGIAGRPRRNGTVKQGPTLGRRWVGLVQRFPAVLLLLVVLGLGAAATPLTRLELALPNDTTGSPDTTQRKAADLKAEGFGPGTNGPLLTLVDAHTVNEDAAALQAMIELQGEAEDLTREDKAARASFLYTVNQINTLSAVEHAQLVDLADDGRAAQILVTPKTGPADPATVDLVENLNRVNAEVERATGVSVGLTGLTAVQVDITERLAQVMPLYLAVVVGVAVLLLIMVFRSLLVPLVAGVGFLLSVGAAFGVTVLFWQEGLGGFVDAPGPLISFMPIFLIGLTFGLAMDYQIFLVTRMREAFAATHGDGLQKFARHDPDARDYNRIDYSTIAGFSQGARVVTAAAVIMIAVFVGFIGQPLPFISIFGFALGVAVLFDAFFIRMTFVPAAMFLMGRGNWWWPRWLDKVIPHLDVEGTSLEDDDEVPALDREERQNEHALRNEQPSKHRTIN